MFISKVIAFALLSLPFITSSAPLSVSNAKSKTQLLYQFPNGTWVENIAVRKNNQILVTLLTTPDLYALDPSKPGSKPRLVHRFANTIALLGIAEFEPDVFAVAAGNFSFASGTVPGSYSIWRVDFACNKDKSEPKISLIAPVPQGALINGVCVLPKDPGSILLADIDAGLIYRMDTRSGAVSVAVPPTNSLVSLGPNDIVGPAGVDGVHVRGDELYVANVGHANFGKLRINPDGSLAPGAEPIILQEAPDGTNEDDFAVDEEGNAFLVTGGGNTIIEVGPTGKQRLIAGNLNSTEIAGPTSVALSRGRESGKKLFVVTGGGSIAPINGNEIVGGQVLAIDLE